MDQKINTQIKTFREWYICVATGGSFYKEYAKDIFTKKETHLFLNCSYDIAISEAMVYAVAKAAGSNDGQALRLAKSKLSNKQLSDFWRGVIRFFAEHEPKNVAQMNDLVDYIHAKKNENPNFTLFGAGHTLQSLLIKMEEWHRALQRVKILGDVRWDGFAVDNFMVVRKDKEDHEVQWNICQILDSKTLAAEGSRMRHCVLSYKNSCVKGEASIWQMVYTDYIGMSHHKITIELRSDGTIVQARGLANRAIRSDERHILNMWAAKEGFRISSYI